MQNACSSLEDRRTQHPVPVDPQLGIHSVRALTGWTVGSIELQVEDACRSWAAPLTPLGRRRLREHTHGLLRAPPPSWEGFLWRLEQLSAWTVESRGTATAQRLSALLARQPEVFSDATVQPLWEEEGLVALHKPWCMRVYLPRDATGQRYRTWPQELTVHDWLMERYPAQRPRMCNRLDFATSGLMLVALSSSAAKAVRELFTRQQVQKTYQALVLGSPPPSWDTPSILDAPLADAPRGAVGPPRRAVGPGGGQAAETRVRVRQRGWWPKALPPDGLAETATAPAEGGAPAPVLRRRRLAAALIEAEPRTGRRHQIRVHLASEQLPILGDDSYGGQPWGQRGDVHRMYLHSWRVRLPWMDQSHLIEDPMDWSQLKEPPIAPRHASENPKLPAKLKELGITFIGPPSGVMAALGDKIAANILAQTAKVPSIPWSGDGLTCELTADGEVPDEVFQKAMVKTVEDAMARAEKVGFPIMVKASEGGGGKGIRKATNMEELKLAFTNVHTEVPGSPIFLMRMVSKARHLEVQILGDEYGNTLALNGRDCSTQRRFQKIFEEGPPTIAKKDV
ncbi:unnamed protein product, partial [Durusdinium trenchii]